MTFIPDPSERLRHVCSIASLEPVTTPQRLESYSNDAWLLDDLRLGPIVLRISWRGDVARLMREVAVAEHMPAGIRYPVVMGKGLTSLRGFPLSYSMTRRLAGQPLAHSWPGLGARDRRAAAAQLSDMLRELHDWTPPAELVTSLLARDDLAHGGITGLLGADITPLPTSRAVTLAEHAMSLEHVDSGLMSDAIAAIEQFRHLEPLMDTPSRHGLIHSDVHLSNLWWSEAGTAIVLDLEWVRFAPPLLDVQRLCENADVDVLNGIDTHPTILRWMEADYPELFQGADAADRILLYSLAYSIRHVIVDPPDRPADALPPEHSVHRLRRLVEGRWPAPGALPESLTPSR